MRILAIDPGPEQSAAVAFDGQQIAYHFIMPNEEMLRLVSTASDKQMVAVEMVASYGMPVGKEVFMTAVWIGRFVQVCAQRGVPWRFVYRQEVKMSVCHDSRAKDSNIRAALIDRFGKPGTKKAPGITCGIKADEWQALAVAVTAFDSAEKDGQS